MIRIWVVLLAMAQLAMGQGIEIQQKGTETLISLITVNLCYHLVAEQEI